MARGDTRHGISMEDMEDITQGNPSPTIALTIPHWEWMGDVGVAWGSNVNPAFSIPPYVWGLSTIHE